LRHLVEEHLRMVVTHGTIGRKVMITEIEDKKLAIVHGRQEARNDVDIVSVRRVASKSWRRHGHDPVRDVGKVQVELLSHKSGLGFRV
jgi:hypothetical protein